MPLKCQFLAEKLDTNPLRGFEARLSGKVWSPSRPALVILLDRFQLLLDAFLEPPLQRPPRQLQ